MVFIEGCLKNLENNKSVVVSLKLIPKLIQSFHNFPGWNIHSFISSLFFHSFIHPFILSFIHSSYHPFFMYFLFLFFFKFFNLQILIDLTWVFSFNYLISEAHSFSLLIFFILFNYLLIYSFNHWFDLICLFVFSINH